MTAAMDHGQKPPRQRISMGPPPPPNMREDELDLFSIFRLIRRRFLLIALITFLLTLLQLPFIMEIRQTYTSTARLLIHKPLTAALVGPAAETYGPADPTTEVERLRATPVAERIIAQFGLDQMEEFNPPPAPPGLLSTIASTVRSYLSSEPPGAPLIADPKNVVLSHYYESLDVYRSGTSDVIEIAFTSENAGLAARIPNALITVYLDELNGQIRAQLVKAKEWLTDRIETQRQRVEDMEAQARTMRQDQVAASKDAEAALAARMVSLNDRQSDIMSERFKLQTTIDAINSASTVADKAALIDTDRMVELSQELRTLQGDLLEMRQTYGDNFSFVVKKRQAIDDIEARIQFEVDRNLRSLETNVAALDTETLSIEKDMADARIALAKTSDAENDLRVMMESVDTERTALAVLEEQRRSLEKEATLPVAEVEIITPATVARWPDGRSKKFYLLVGMIVSGMIGRDHRHAARPARLDRA